MSDHAMTRGVLVNLLDELVDGAGAEAAFVLNPKDPGLLASLERLSAERASAVPVDGGSSIAAHVDHLRYGLSLMRRWSRGEEPFADAEYQASWQRLTVTDAEWRARIEELRGEASSWRAVLREPRDLNEIGLTGIVSSVVHLAYHVGAIRQIDRATRGPSASD